MKRADLEQGGERAGRQRLAVRLAANLPVAQRTIEAAGIATAVLEGGKGTPVLLLHGPGELAARWLRVIPGLAARHRVIAPDLPGHGSSAMPEGELGPDRMVRWLDDVIARTCAEPPAVVGHILGGAIAARFAAEHPDRLRALVLVDAMGLAPFRPAPRFALALLTFLSLPSARSYDRLMVQCEHDSERLAAEMGEDWDVLRDYFVERARSREAKAALRALMTRVGVPVIPTADLERIAVPTTLIWGRHDRALRLAIAEQASARHGWPLHVIEDAADDAPLERPETFLAALLPAVASRPTGRHARTGAA